MRRSIIISTVLLSGLLLVSCGKTDKRNSAAASGDCTKVKAAPPYQTYEQAVQECQSRHNMAAQPDPKPSNTPMSNR